MNTSFTRNEKTAILTLAAAIAIGVSAQAFMKPNGAGLHFTAAPQSAPGVMNSPAKFKSNPSDKSNRSDKGGNAADAFDADGRLDLNRATQTALESLPGIGKSKATAIIDYRTLHGSFHDVRELDNVKGIGPTMMAKILPKVTIGASAGIAPPQGSGPAAPAAPPNASSAASLAPQKTFGQFGATPAPQTAMSAVPPAAQPVQQFSSAPQAPAASGLASTSGKSAKGSGEPVNINTATAEQLATLIHVGPKLAEKIIEYRNTHGPFATPEALDDVKGIGPRILEENKARIVVR